MSLNEFAGFDDLDKDPKTAWATIKNPDKYQHAYYIILRGLSCKKPQEAKSQILRLKKAFGPVVNKNELNNGRKPYDTLRHILWFLQWCKPQFPVSDDQYQAVKQKATELYKVVYVW